MKKKYIPALLLSFIILPNLAAGADTLPISGTVGLGFNLVDEENNSAKFQEYRDLDDTAYGMIDISGVNGQTHINLTGNNIGMDDQSYQFILGQYGISKFSLMYDDTPHNYTFGAKTGYSGIGTNNLSFAGGGAIPAESTWSSFDYAIKRSKFGGSAAFNFNSPFYLNASVHRLDTEGLKPLIITDRFTERAEIPEPIQHSTNSMELDFGYQTEQYLFELSGMLSSFENDFDSALLFSPTDSTKYVFSLPPDNDYKKIGAKFVVQDLPYSSSLSVSGSHGRVKNTLTTSQLNLAADASSNFAARLASLNTTTFEGDKTFTDILAAITSRPTMELDTKFSFTHQENSNKSTIIADSTNTNADHLFDFSKDVFAAEAGYRLPQQTKLTGSYEYVTLDRRNRPEFETTTDHIFTARLKNSSLEHATAQIQFKHLERDSDPTGGTNVAISDFDANDKSLDEAKLGIELYPMDNIDIGMDYTYTSTDYDQPVLTAGNIRGRGKDDSHALYLDALWRLPQGITLGGLVGYETREIESTNSNLSGGTNTPWGQNVEDDFWTYGLTGKMPLMDDKLHLDISWEYQKSDGESNFSIDPTLQNIATVADYSKKKLEAKATYSCSEKIGVTVGYLYEKYQYVDLQYENYAYIAPGSTYLSGAYAFNDYEANVGYAMLRYSF